MATEKNFNWDIYGKHVQNDIDETRLIGPKSTLIMVPRDANGRITMETKDATSFVPIGLIQSFNMQQNKDMQPVAELGSARSYYATGLTQRTITLQRVLYSGKNMLRIMAGDPGLNDQVEAYRKAGIKGGDFYLNLASPLFDRPMTLVLMLAEASGITSEQGESISMGAHQGAVQSFTNVYAAVALEYAFIQNHGLTIQGGSAVVAESSTIVFDRMMPLEVTKSA